MNQYIYIWSLPLAWLFSFVSTRLIASSLQHVPMVTDELLTLYPHNQHNNGHHQDETFDNLSSLWMALGRRKFVFDSGRG